MGLRGLKSLEFRRKGVPRLKVLKTLFKTLMNFGILALFKGDFGGKLAQSRHA
jgi:hypothetical protein